MMEVEEINELTSFTKEKVDEMLINKEKYSKLIEEIENKESDDYKVFEDNEDERVWVSKEKKNESCQPNRQGYIFFNRFV